MAASTPSARTALCRPSPGRACPTPSRRRRCASRIWVTGTTRLIGESLCDRFEARDGWLASGMETGVQERYDKLEALLAEDQG